LSEIYRPDPEQTCGDEEPQVLSQEFLVGLIRQLATAGRERPLKVSRNFREGGIVYLFAEDGSLLGTALDDYIPVKS
jgi:hypothetical protein